MTVTSVRAHPTGHDTAHRGDQGNWLARSGPVRPFSVGAQGDHVVDLKARLGLLGFDCGEPVESFTEHTAGAVRAFQVERGIDADGVVGPQTWAVLVEAGHLLGDRLIYLHNPVMRGDDVAEAQRMLSTLGFLAGRVDGIWGPKTGSALVEFQHNAGLVPDGVCGVNTIVALRRVSTRLGDMDLVADIEEQELLLRAELGLVGARIAVGHTGGLGSTVAAVRRALDAEGAIVLPLSHPSWAAQAPQANRFGAVLFVGCEVRPGETSACYFRGRHFVSNVGQTMATRLASHLRDHIGLVDTRGMALPMLRDSAMPAVLLRLQSAQLAVQHAHEIAMALRACAEVALSEGGESQET